VPEGTYGRVAPRSGLAWKHHIDVGAGVIDADYRGNVGVVLFNHSEKDFPVQVGDRVAQLILERIIVPDVVEVQELPDTIRGAGGFGSTGMAGNTPTMNGLHDLPQSPSKRPRSDHDPSSSSDTTSVQSS